MRTTGVRCYELSKVRSNTDGGFHETTGGKADNQLHPRLSAFDPKRTKRACNAGKSAHRAACTFSDKPVPGFSCASAPCLSHCRAEPRIVRFARAMP